MKITIVFLTLLIAHNAYSAPQKWEPNYGAAIDLLTGQDNSEARVELSFVFPFKGDYYTTIYVGTNGGLQLGNLGVDNKIDYNHWDHMEEFLSDGTPSIAGFNTNLDLTKNGAVHFNDLGDRAIFTWNEVGTHKNLDALITFQVQLNKDGSILFSYNGVLDGSSESLIDDIGEGIVIGVTAGLEPMETEPGPSDFGRNFTSSDTEVYQRWCFDKTDGCAFNGDRSKALSGPTNSEFDCDQQSIVLTPAGNGFTVGNSSNEVYLVAKAANGEVVSFCL